jgi:hypothetical protein
MPRHFSDDRRRAPRRSGEQVEALLQGGLSLIDAKLDEDDQEYSLKLFGSTQNISATGLSLVIPHFPIDTDYCAEEDKRRLWVILYLPTGTVEMKVAPVRCTPLDQERPEKGFFIGAQIEEIDHDGRERFTRYLDSCR